MVVLCYGWGRGAGVLRGFGFGSASGSILDNFDITTAHITNRGGRGIFRGRVGGPLGWLRAVQRKYNTTSNVYWSFSCTNTSVVDFFLILEKGQSSGGVWLRESKQEVCVEFEDERAAWAGCRADMYRLGGRTILSVSSVTLCRLEVCLIESHAILCTTLQFQSKDFFSGARRLSILRHTRLSQGAYVRFCDALFKSTFVTMRPSLLVAKLTISPGSAVRHLFHPAVS